MKRISNYIWRKYGVIGTCFAVSIGVHVVGLAVFGSYKLFQYIYPRDATFEAVPFSRKAVQLRTIEHKISLKKPPQQNPRVIRRLSVNRLAKINLPTLPQRDAASRKFEVSKNFLDGGSIFGESYNVAENLFGTAKQMDNAFEGKIYELADGTDKIPTHWPAKFIGKIYTPFLNVPVQSFDKGFPGVSDRFEWFAIDYTAQMYISVPGEYQWRLSSDDGSILSIDGNVIIDNNGVHGDNELMDRNSDSFKKTMGKRQLRVGIHKINVKYFQGPRYGVSLRLWVTPPDGTEAIFNLANFPVPVQKR